ncbi:MAG: hypothetical protein ABI777_09140 [Betaproteobacteria bacterium]
MTILTRAARAIWWLAALSAPAATFAASITSVPPAENGVRAPARAAAITMAVIPDVPATRVDLSPVTGAEERKVLSANTATGGKGRPFAIGFGREVDDARRSIALAGLVWRTGADGKRYARIDVASPGAKAVRVAMQFDATTTGLTLGFSGASDTTGNVEVSGDGIAAARVDGVYWSPVVDGDVMRIVLRADATMDLARTQLIIPRVSHLLVAGADLNPMSTKGLKGIGSSESCNIDVACVTPQSAAFTSMTRAVVKISFVQDDGGSYSCTATLLNDSVTSFTPYLFTANHCILSARTARTINSYWFFDATVCGGSTAGPYIRLSGGAALLGRSQDRDWALVRLYDAAPANAYFAAWRAEALAAGTTVSTIHHPSGDLKKWSRGAATGDSYLDDLDALGVFSSVVWQQGTTEGGSSGAALLTFSSTGGYYEVRGGLFSGSASCSNLNGTDDFSQLQAGLPLLRQYLTPDNANPGGQVAATEFYNQTLNHYFLSTNPVEIANLDSGKTVGWVRTGLRFLVYNTPVAGTNPVCRFYRAPAYGDSHFYSASPTECANTAAAHPVDWIYESPNVFYAALPSAAGTCAAGMSPVYRFFNVNTTNHRYTAELVVRNELAATAGWVAEGYGPGPYFPVMCALTP